MFCGTAGNSHGQYGRRERGGRVRRAARRPRSPSNCRKTTAARTPGGSPGGCGPSRTAPRPRLTSAAASARRGADTAARRSAATARRGAGGARRGAGTAGRGVTAGLNWLTAQVVAMGPRLRIRDRPRCARSSPASPTTRSRSCLSSGRRGPRRPSAARREPGPRCPRCPRSPRRSRRRRSPSSASRSSWSPSCTRSTAWRPRAARRSGRAPTSGRGRPAAAFTRWTSGLLLIAGSPLARQLTRRLACARPPVDVLARPAVHRRGRRGDDQPAGDAAARPPDP